MACVDADRDRATELAREATTRVSSWEEVLSADDVDAVVLTLPHDLHCQFAVEAARAGKHILVEKPMATTVAECDRMIDAAQQTNVCLFVAHVLRFQEANVLIEELINSGRLGKAFFAEYWSAQRPEFPPSRMHLADPVRGGGVILAGESHHTDLMRYWLGEVKRVRGYHLAVREVYRQLDSPEFSLVTYEFENGAVAVTSYSYATYVCPELPLTKSVVCFERGTVHTGSDGLVTIASDDGEVESVQTDAGKAAPQEIAHLTSAILDGAPLRVTPQDGRRAVQLCVAAEQSAHLGCDVEV